MKRRAVLRRSGAILTAILAGCTGSNTSPSGQQTSTGTSQTTPGTTDPTPTRTAATTYRGAFEAFLSDLPLSVETLAVDSAAQTVTLQYVTTKSGYEAIGREIGAISGGFFRQVANGWQVARLDATLLDAPDKPAATWYAKTEWFREFQNDQLNSEELSLRILETLEPVESTPN